MRLGDVIGERFELQELAGAGGMGQVFRALDRASGSVVAVKTLREDRSGDRARFDREARALAGLRHPGIVQYLAHGLTADAKPFLAMEWVEGEGLHRRLARGRLSIHQSVTLGTRIAEALAHAHARGIVHRDLKPGNIALFHDDPAQVKVLDFGLAWLGDESRLTQSGLLVGTPGYMSPEQARCATALDARTDVFALGCVLFECVTGARAFDGEHLMAVLAKLLFEEPPRMSRLRPDVPAALDRLVGGMLAKDPLARPADGASVAGALANLGEAVAREEPPPAPALTTGERRLFSVVLIGRPPRASAAVARAETDTIPPAPRAALDAEALAPVEGALRQEAEANGGRFERLADGSAVIVVAAAGIATDQVARAARCALLARALRPSLPVALATGRSDSAGGTVVSEVIDRAAALLAPGPEGPARPEAGAAAPPVMTDEVTAGLLEPLFEVVQWPWGLEIRGERSHLDGPRVLLGKPTPCVGRERELAELAAIFSECVAEPAASAVLVTAPAGAGKSRLAQELLRELRERHPAVRIWIGKGDALRGGSAYGALGQAIRGACGIRDGEPPAVAQEKLRARVGSALGPPAAERVAELLGELARVPFPGEASASLRAARENTQLLGQQMRAAWEDWLRAECAVHPVLLVLEDLHWVDHSSLALVDAALRALGPRPFMVLATARPEARATALRLGAERTLQEMRLRTLRPRASAQLVQQVLGDSISPAEVDRIVSLSDGHPFYLEELIRAVAGDRNAKLPETLVSMVAARLEALDPEARRLLRSASIFGEVFWSGAVASLLGAEPAAPTPRLEHWLQWLEEHEVLVRRAESRFPGEGEWCFRHALLREGAFGMLTDGDRELGHRLAAEWLEKRADPAGRTPNTPEQGLAWAFSPARGRPDRSGEASPSRIAEHYELGGRPAQAARWYRRAAEHGLWAGDSSQAIAWAQRGLSLCAAVAERQGVAREEFALQLSLASALWMARSMPPPEVEQALHQALRLSERLDHGPERILALFGLARLGLAQGKLSTTRGFAEQLLQLSRQNGGGEATLVGHYAIAAACTFAGDLDGARRHFEAFLALYRRGEHPSLSHFLFDSDPEVQCLSVLGLVLWSQGDFAAATASIDRALAIAETLDQPFTLISALTRLAILRHLERDRGGVKAAAERAMALAAEHRIPRGGVQATILRGWAITERGGGQEGLAQMRKAMEGWRGGLGSTLQHVLHAGASAAAGQLDQALAALDAGFAAGRAEESRLWLPEFHRLKGEVLRERDGAAAGPAAQECFLQAIDAARAQGALALELRASASMGRLWRDQDRGEEARQVVATALARFPEGSRGADLDEARALLAEQR